MCIQQAYTSYLCYMCIQYTHEICFLHINIHPIHIHTYIHTYMYLYTYYIHTYYYIFYYIQVGKLLDVMDKYDGWRNTVVILTADHGKK